jgi:FixJ family two-component response regulator
VADGFRFPIIFMTGRDDEATRRQAAASGCVALMHKPFFAGMLIDTLFKASNHEPDEVTW